MPGAELSPQGPRPIPEGSASPEGLKSPCVPWSWSCPLASSPLCICVQTWPQPLLQHFWPWGHSLSELHRSKHVPRLLGMGHSPSLPARQNALWGTHLWAPTMENPASSRAGLDRGSHLWACPCRHGHSWCGCISVLGGTACQHHTALGTGRHRAVAQRRHRALW